jgi:hypothetical protein
MNTDSNNIPFPNTPEGAGENAHVEPAQDATPQAAADELLAHGLLTYLHNDRPEVQSRRIDRVMGTITREVAESSGRATHRFRFPIRTARGWLALAAGIALVATATFIGLPSEASAQAVVEQSIAAMRAAGAGGDRRYEVRFTVHGTDGSDVELKPATVDMRAPNELLLLATAPDGHQVIAGRDDKGDWCYRREQDGGGVEREHPERAWPRWSKVGEESLFADSVDRLLEELTKGYDLTRESDATLAGHTGAFRHVIAERKRPRGPGGDKVEIWIDPNTNAVERIEMKWNDPPAADGHGPDEPAPDDASGGQPGDQPGAGRGQNDRPLGSPDGRRPPRPGMGSDGPRGGDDANGDRPPPHRRPRPDGGPADGPDAGPMDGPDGGPMDGPPDRPHPRPGFGGPLGPDGAPGPDDLGPGNGPRAGGPPPPFPGGLGPAGPRGPGNRRLPPKLLIIQRVEAPNFADNWFSPEGHASK